MLSTLRILLDYYNKEIAFAIKNTIDVMEKKNQRKKIDFDLQPIHTHFR